MRQAGARDPGTHGLADSRRRADPPKPQDMPGGLRIHLPAPRRQGGAGVAATAAPFARSGVVRDNGAPAGVGNDRKLPVRVRTQGSLSR